MDWVLSQCGSCNTHLGGCIAFILGVLQLYTSQVNKMPSAQIHSVCIYGFEVFNLSKILSAKSLSSFTGLEITLGLHTLALTSRRRVTYVKSTTFFSLVSQIQDSVHSRFYRSGCVPQVGESHMYGSGTFSFNDFFFAWAAHSLVQ